MAEPPYGIIADLLKQGLVTPFLGAGASLSGRPPGAQWDEKTSTFLPTAHELASRLAEDAAFPSPDPKDKDDPNKASSYYLAEADRSDLAKVSSYYAEESADRASLVSFIHKMFDRDYQAGEVHRFLADLEIPLLIVTTNYDDLIERAFKAKGKPFHLVTYPAADLKEIAGSVLWWKPNASAPEPWAPAKLPLSLTDTTIIYKMHGSVDRITKKFDSYVITEEDYIDFIARMTAQLAIPARFMLEFGKRRFLFLGYGLRDWNFRVMLKNLRSALARPDAGAATGDPAPADAPVEQLRSWAIQMNPSELEQELWAARKVNIYSMDIDTFVARLRGRMAA
jgi:SIR2-like protein